MWWIASVKSVVGINHARAGNAPTDVSAPTVDPVPMRKQPHRSTAQQRHRVEVTATAQQPPMQQPDPRPGRVVSGVELADRRAGSDAVTYADCRRDRLIGRPEHAVYDDDDAPSGQSAGKRHPPCPARTDHRPDTGGQVDAPMPGSPPHGRRPERPDHPDRFADRRDARSAADGGYGRHPRRVWRRSPVSARGGRRGNAEHNPTQDEEHPKTSHGPNLHHGRVARTPASGFGG